MAKRKPDDVCPAPTHPPAITATEPKSPPIYMSSVYKCETTGEARAMLLGEQPGYVYLRDSNPNADLLAERCSELHHADEATILPSGMAALALALVSQLQQGDHVLLSQHLYGRTKMLFQTEGARLGITCDTIDCTQLDQVETALTDQTRMVVVESIANPCLQVADLTALGEVAHRRNARLLVDNTIASPIHCQPLLRGADLVVESMTKIMNGHSDVVLGLLAGKSDTWERVESAQSSWGWTPSAMDCWLAQRGLATLAIRAQRAAQNAMAIAEFLQGDERVTHVDYPGLPGHPHHAIATRMLTDGFSHMVTFRLPVGADPDRVLAATRESIPFCPSLGEFTTTFSHPSSTSHLRATLEENSQVGIYPETLRLSVGIESPDHLIEVLQAAL